MIRKSFCLVCLLTLVFSCVEDVLAQSSSSKPSGATGKTAKSAKPAAVPKVASNPSTSRKPGEPTPATRPAVDNSKPENNKEKMESASLSTSVEAKPEQGIGAEETQITSPSSVPKIASIPVKPMVIRNSNREEILSGLKGADVDLDASYKLRYAMKKGDVIESEVVHLAKTITKINDVSQSSQSRTISSKVWTVTEVQADGNIQFFHQINSVDLSQQVGDGEEQKFNSEVDTDPPVIFRKVAETIGKPLATITISSTGAVVDRSEPAAGSNLGMGDITIPFPEDEIRIGDQWETPREIRVRRVDGSPKVVKIRELYTLEKVSAGVAVISIRSEPLTPLAEPEIESQALQQMSNGTIRFDLDAGRLISKLLVWDKSVVGFSGPGSVMDYSARYEETVK